MQAELKLNEIGDAFGSLQYPVSSTDVVAAVGDVHLRYADGSERLSVVLARSSVDQFETAGDLESEVFNNLPTEAVGEPGQSEGEG